MIFSEWWCSIERLHVELLGVNKNMVAVPSSTDSQVINKVLSWLQIGYWLSWLNQMRTASYTKIAMVFRWFLLMVTPVHWVEHVLGHWSAFDLYTMFLVWTVVLVPVLDECCQLPFKHPLYVSHSGLVLLGRTFDSSERGAPAEYIQRHEFAACWASRMAMCYSWV